MVIAFVLFKEKKKTYQGYFVKKFYFLAADALNPDLCARLLELLKTEYTM